MKIILLVLAALSLVIFSVMLNHHVYASICAYSETLYFAPQFFRLSDKVFVGTVSSINNSTNHEWKVKFDVEKAWKGISAQQVTIISNSLEGCGYSISKGEKYLVYANGYPPFLLTTYSKPYADAQNEITLFDDPKFQAKEKIKGELIKKLDSAASALTVMMASKKSDIPINAVGVDEINSILVVGIDSAKATVSAEEYQKRIKEIVGDIPIKIEFGQVSSLVPVEPSDPLKQSSKELRGFGRGILEFNKNLDDDFSCNDVAPKPETKTVERKKDQLLNLDEKPGYFFIILGQLNSASYQYLQIGLHRGNDSAGPVANPSYFIDLKKQEQPIMSGLYQGNPSLAVVLESDKEETSIHLEDNYKQYLGGTSKDVTYPTNRLGLGEYDFHAILFQSDKPEWIQHDICAISLNWDFSVNDDGVITTNPPKTEKGKLRDVTKEFPPLQQHNKGVNIGDIECRHGLQLLMKTKDGTPACVKPESVTKLVTWGWARTLEP